MFTTYEVPRYIKTSHVLFIQWDSWIVDPVDVAAAVSRLRLHRGAVVVSRWT